MTHERNRRMFFASGVGFAQRLVQIGASVITLPLALHVLGVEGFGIWGAATSLAWLSGMLDLGLGSALITLIPRAISAGKSDEGRSHVTAALICSCCLSAVIGAVGVTLVMTGMGATRATPFLVAVVGLALNVPLSIAGNVWFALQRGYVAGGWELIQTLLSLALILAAVVFHGGVTTMVLAVYGSLVLTNCASLIHLFVRHPEIRPSRRYPPLGSLHSVVGQSGMLFAISVAVACSYMFDNLLTLHWLGATASAQMTMAMRLCTTVAGVIGVLTQSFWPAFVEAGAVGDRLWATRTLIWGTLTVFTVSAIGAAVIGSFGVPILTWWLRADLGIAPGLLWTAGIWIVVMCTPRVSALLLTASLILRSQLAAVTAALALSLALKAVLASYFGPIGILAATPISWLLIVWPVFTWLALRWHAEPHPEAMSVKNAARTRNSTA